MKIVFFFTGIYLFVILIGCGHEIYPSQWDESMISNASVEIKTLIDGISDTNSNVAMLGRIGEIHVDRNQNFYVSDLISQSIKKFDATGVFRHEYGRRGRGSGEFMGIRSFSVSHGIKNMVQLTVIDDINKVVSIYSKEGNLITSLSVPLESEFPRGIFKSIAIDKEIKHLFLYKLYEGASDQNCLFHLFDQNFSIKEKCFGDFRDLRYHHNTTFGYLTQAQAGYMTIDDNYTIYYTPRFYDGAIYTYTYNAFDQNWEYSGSLNGLVHYTLPFKENAEPSDYHLGYRNQRLYGRLLNISLGLFHTSEGIVHFTRITTPENEIWFGKEIYNPDGTLQVYNKIYSVPAEESDRWNYMIFSDSMGRYYLAGNHDIPGIYQIIF